MVVEERLKSDHQEMQYDFPYHWLPQIHADGRFGVGRHLKWGLEYLTYMDAVSSMVKEIGPRNVLDVGCGDGRLGNFLAQTGCDYRGIDRSETAIDLAQALNRSGKYSTSDLVQINEKFDVIALVEVLEHIPEDELPAFLGSLSKLVSPSGCLVVSVPTSNRPTNPKHFRHYDGESLANHLMLGGFSIERSIYLYRIGTLTRLLQRFVCNRFFTLNPSRLTALLWRIHRQFSYIGNSVSGAHLLVVARLNRNSGEGRGN